MPTAPKRSCLRFRKAGVGLLLLLLPACGLSDYENLMRKTQEREERFREEKKYLDEPVKVPTRKDKDDHDVPVAHIFFRPPKGIQSKYEDTPRNNLLWHYSHRTGSDFEAVELAFADEEKNFAAEVLRNYQANEAAQPRVRELNPPNLSDREKRQALIFDNWEFDSGQTSYSVNVLRGDQPQIAIIYIFGKGRRDNVRRAIELSLESLALGRHVSAARQNYARKTPWQLRSGRAP